MLKKAVAGVGALALGVAGIGYIKNQGKMLHLLDQIVKRLELRREDLDNVADIVLEQMILGLKGEEGGLMMLPSFVDIFPTGNETGEYFAIDLGGTSLKVVWVKLGAEPRAVDDEEVQEWPIPDECYDTDNGKLLDWVAEHTLDLIKRHGYDGKKKIPVIGLCYSFACEQTDVGNGKQLLWTKRFKGQGLIGKDVVEALVEEFAKKGYTVSIPALMNDSVASLAGAQYHSPDVKIGIILGTGTNCAYIESVENIRKLPKKYTKRGNYMIINTEWGDAKLDGTVPVCEEDLWVDFASTNPGHGLFEKLISGLYVGDVARRIILHIAEETGCFGGMPSPIGSGLSKPNCFNGAHLSRIFHDESSDLQHTAEVLSESCGIKKLTYREREIAKRICVLVARRSARLCAAAMVAVLRREFKDSSSNEDIVISVDGSSFTKFEGYQDLVRMAIDEILDDTSLSQRVRIKLASGSSVMGAAVVAALLHQE